MSNGHETVQLAVIGGGPGGYAAAFTAADLGIEVVLIDLDENPGGTCLHRGCIPSKALLHAAKVLNDARDAREWGITFPEPEIDLDKLRENTDAIVKKMTGGLGQLCKARKIKHIRARASFEDSNLLKLVTDAGDERLLGFEHVIVAPGSRPALFDPFLVESPRVMNSTTALELPDIPDSLLVVGGGYIGLELGSVYATLGSKVTVVEVMPQLLPGADADLVAPLASRLEKYFDGFLLGTKVVDVEETDDGIKVRFEGPEGTPDEATFSKVLVCIGRKANSSGLGLGSTKVEVDEHGYIVVDEQRRTADPHIFAIGDVTGQPMLAHKASHEGRVAAEVVGGGKAAFEPRAIPAVVFTDPEIAWCGLTETQAEQEGRKIKLARFPWGASGRATTLHRDEGQTKIIADAETDEVLGVGIVGTGAGELISEGVLAIEMGAVASDIEFTIHPHPTLAETIMESAEVIFGHSIHIQRPKPE